MTPAITTPLGPPFSTIPTECWSIGATLVEAENGRYHVQIPLSGDRQIVVFLNALEKYVAQRGDGPARLELDGRSYTLHPE